MDEDGTVLGTVGGLDKLTDEIREGAAERLVHAQHRGAPHCRLGQHGVLQVDVLGDERLERLGDGGLGHKRCCETPGEVVQEIERAERKLANEGFVAKAPEHLVAAEREKLERLRRELEAV